MPKVLILEPHPYHNEVLPGIERYLTLLGYDVVIMIQEKAHRDNAFCRYQASPPILVFRPDNVRQVLANQNLKEYDFVFFSSLEYLHDGIEDNVIQFLGKMPKTKYGIMGIYHSLDYIGKFKDEKLFDEGRIFSLSEYKFNDYPVRMLNPHYFGEHTSEHVPSAKKKFVIVGSKQERQLVESVTERLCRNGYSEFEICIIGSRDKNTRPFKNLLKKLLYPFFGFFGLTWSHSVPYKKSRLANKFIRDTGRVTFKELYNEMETCDFSLILLRPEIEYMKKFMISSTTGAKQLTLGFHKPCIIHRSFAEAYGFSDEDSILYEGDGLYAAMEKALVMENRQYAVMMEKMTLLAEHIEKQSIYNLQEAIYRISVDEDNYEK